MNDKQNEVYNNTLFWLREKMRSPRLTKENIKINEDRVLETIKYKSGLHEYRDIRMKWVRDLN